MALPTRFTVVAVGSGVKVTCTEERTGLYRCEWLDLGRTKFIMSEESTIRGELAQGLLKDYKEYKWQH